MRVREQWYSPGGILEPVLIVESQEEAVDGEKHDDVASHHQAASPRQNLEEKNPNKIFLSSIRLKPAKKLPLGHSMVLLTGPQAERMQTRRFQWPKSSRTP